MRSACEFSRIYAVTVALALLAACPLVAPGEDAGVSDGGEASPCRDELRLGEVIDLQPAAPDTQIHINAAFDGRGVWITYNLPDTGGLFDVWAARLACDGSFLV